MTERVGRLGVYSVKLLRQWGVESHLVNGQALSD